MSSTYDVIISGAGPAGSTAALHLKSSGLRVLLLDKASFPRDKICGDALSGTVGFELSKLGLDVIDTFVRTEPKQTTFGLRFISPGRHTFDLKLKTTRTGLTAPGYLFPRKHFDYFLFNQVVSGGRTDIQTSCTVQSYTQTEEGITVHTNQGDYPTRYFIVADGAQSNIVRQLNASPAHAHLSAGLRQYYQGVTGFTEDSLIELHFIRDILPGYFWIFPLPNGMANVGIGMRSDIVIKKKIQLRQLFHQIIHTHPDIEPRFRNAEPLETPRGYPLPMGSHRPSLVHGHILLVGDAASCIDPFTGEGIGYAMTSGRIAAETIIKAVASDNAAIILNEYSRNLYRSVGAKFDTGYRLQQLLRYPWLFDHIVLKANRNPRYNDFLQNTIEGFPYNTNWKKFKYYAQLIWPF